MNIYFVTCGYGERAKAITIMADSFFVTDEGILEFYNLKDSSQGIRENNIDEAVAAFFDWVNVAKQDEG